MYLIAGLGNPSPRYDQTPHNLGREVVMHWAASDGIVTGESPEPHTLHIPNFKGLALRAIDDEQEIIVVPDLGTFMNESGAAVQTILSFYKIPPTSLILVHDELALPLGTLRLGRNLSAAGHNGVQSVITTIGTQDFIRLRLGVEVRDDHQIPSEEILLKKMEGAAQEMAAAMVLRGADALGKIIDVGLERAMTTVNQDSSPANA